MTSTSKKNTIFTIGHSNHPLDHFLDLLTRHKIKLLIDVRSHPYSRFFPHFNKARLEQSVTASGRIYLYLGNLLGGKPDAPEFYDADGYVLYHRLAQTPPFHDGLARLLTEARRHRTAIMCAEEDPAQCHRRLLITPALLDHGMTVMHIRRDFSLIPESELRNLESGPQQSLFGDRLGGNWKSAIPIRPPKN